MFNREQETRPGSKMTTSNSNMVPGEKKEEPIVSKKETVAKGPAISTNPSEVVVEGKLYKSVAYTQDGSVSYKLEEVK